MDIRRKTLILPRLQLYILLQILTPKVKLQLPLTVAHFLVRGFFKFIATKEPNSGNCGHIFSRDNRSKKI